MIKSKRPARSNLSDYYEPIRLNPVGHDISRSESMRLHEFKRRNLLEHLLKLPFVMWKGCRVLEFGPASGENAVVLARHGAKMTFVEPLEYLIDELNAKFAQAGVSDRIEAIHQDVVETFKSEQRYDFVSAEGFMHFLDDSTAGVRKLTTFLAPGGFVLVSLIHSAGCFIEFVKTSYLAMAANALGLESSEERFELARALFADQFQAINHSRNFEKWAKDMLLNPLNRPRHFMDLPKTLSALPDDVALYSSWPNYIDADDLIWHKNIKDAATLRAETLRAYYARAPHFIHSVPCRPGELPLFDPEDGRRIVSALEAYNKEIERAILAKASTPARHLAALSKLRRVLAPHSEARQSLRIVDEAIALFGAARKASAREDFVRAWTSCGLHRMWGTPGHYWVFQKTDLFSRGK